MSLSGIITVLWYSALPWLWLIALMVVIFIVPQAMARMRGYGFTQPGGMGSKYLPPVVFVLSLFLLPLHTQSTIGYVFTWVDWLNLLGASFGLGLYAWLVFHPICFMRNLKS